MSEEKPDLRLYEVFSNEAIFAIFTFDLDKDRCIYANRMAKEIFAINSKKEMVAFKINSLFPAEDRGNLTALAESHLELEGLFRDLIVNRPGQYAIIANVGIKKHKNFLSLMIQDTTVQKKLQREIQSKQNEIKEAYEELLMQNQQLKELDVAKNRFIALTTHELRTPLSAVMASAEILKLGLYDTDEQLKEFIDMIYEQGHHLSTLINDILDFAKIQAGKMDFYISARSICPILEELIESHKKVADQSGVTIRIQDSEAKDTPCYFDELRIKQVLDNIISNAIKYNRDNGSVDIKVLDNSNFLEIHVTDTGNGISEEQMAEVFNEFETLGKVANHQKGTGLGMPISKRLIEGMGGEIQLRSEVGKGTTFWITIPKDKVLDEEHYRHRPEDPGDLLAS